MQWLSILVVTEVIDDGTLPWCYSHACLPSRDGVLLITGMIEVNVYIPGCCRVYKTSCSNVRLDMSKSLELGVHPSPQ